MSWPSPYDGTTRSASPSEQAEARPGRGRAESLSGEEPGRCVGLKSDAGPHAPSQEHKSRVREQEPGSGNHEKRGARTIKIPRGLAHSRREQGSEPETRTAHQEPECGSKDAETSKGHERPGDGRKGEETERTEHRAAASRQASQSRVGRLAAGRSPAGGGGGAAEGCRGEKNTQEPPSAAPAGPQEHPPRVDANELPVGP